jgi:hypothetical protein
MTAGKLVPDAIELGGLAVEDHAGDLLGGDAGGAQATHGWRVG